MCSLFFFFFGSWTFRVIFVILTFRPVARSSNHPHLVIFFFLFSTSLTCLCRDEDPVAIRDAVMYRVQKFVEGHNKKVSAAEVCR